MVRSIVAGLYLVRAWKQRKRERAMDQPKRENGQSPAEIAFKNADVRYLILRKVIQSGGGFTHARVCKSWRDCTASYRTRIIISKGARLEESALIALVTKYTSVTTLVIEKHGLAAVSDALVASMALALKDLEVLVIGRVADVRWSAQGLAVLFQSCRKIQHLDLARTDAGRSPVRIDYSSVDYLQGLNNLHLGRHTILPQTISRLQSLRSLTLHRCGLNCQLVNALGTLTALTFLSIECPHRSTVPAGVLSIQALEHLQLRNWTKLTCFSVDFGRLNRLTSLLVHGVEAEELHFAHFLPQSLRSLTFAKCNLQSLPHGIWNLGNLRRIVLKGLRKIESIPQNVTHSVNIVIEN